MTNACRGGNEAVRKQSECGIDIVTDGEFSKPGFFTYIQDGSKVSSAAPTRR